MKHLKDAIQTDNSIGPVNMKIIYGPMDNEYYYWTNEEGIQKCQDHKYSNKYYFHINLSGWQTIAKLYYISYMLSLTTGWC